MSIGGPIRVPRVRVVVLVSRPHPLTRRALTWAELMSPSVEALTVQADPARTQALMSWWCEHRIDIPLTAVECHGELVDPVVEHLRKLQASHPDDLVAVVLPRYVVGRWWEFLLHHRRGRRLEAVLRQMDGVSVTTVPWVLPMADHKEVVTSEPG